ncbi:MAG: dihydroorotase, partial [Muribaculaceae bacterium]|nr:dihydroorotase [Muribaculaceae bacterium]
MAHSVIHNAKIVNEGKAYSGYVVTNGELIESVGKGKVPAAVIAGADSVTDACGAWLMPGVIDDHVHFRDPGLTHKGDISTESRAAVAGGVTSYMDMPNTNPVTVTKEAWEAKMRRAAEVSAANYAFWIGATNDNLTTLKSMDYSEVPGVKLFLGSSTGNMLVDSTDSISRVFSEVNALVAVHAEDNARINAAIKEAKEIYGDEPVPVDLHPVIRDTEACYRATKRAIELAKKYNTRLHIMHVSTAAEVRLLEPVPMSERRITSETCIQYLWWCDKDYEALGTRMKCNPAIKADSDRRALRRAVRDGLIDVIGSDHAPHLLSEKHGDALTAPSGCPNMQYQLVMMMELVAQKVLKVETVVQRMSHAPADLFGIERRGYLRPGYYADMVLVSKCEPVEVTDADCAGRCGWLPLAGTTVSHRVE